IHYLSFPTRRSSDLAQTLHGLDSSKFSTLPLCGYLVKIRMDNRLPAGVLSLLLGDLDALPLALQNILPFQLRHSSKYREHEFPRDRKSTRLNSSHVS